MNENKQKYPHASRGSVSIMLLVIVLIMALLAQLALLWSKQELKQTTQYVFMQQLRHLNGSCFDALKDMELPDGRWQYYAGELQPGSEQVEVNVSKTSSSDGLLHYLEVTSTGANHVGALQRLCRLKMDFSTAQQALAADGIVLASKKITGLEYLPQGAKYIQASTEEVRLPKLDFFYQKAASGITSTDLETEGISGRFVYISKSSGTVPSFTISSTKYKKPLRGAALFGSKGSILVATGTHFPDRLALYSYGSDITLGSNVRMDKALIHAYRTVTIGAGCKINGLIIANEIILKGPSTLTAESECVAPFYSAAYVNQ